MTKRDLWYILYFSALLSVTIPSGLIYTIGNHFGYDIVDETEDNDYVKWSEDPLVGRRLGGAIRMAWYVKVG